MSLLLGSLFAFGCSDIGPQTGEAPPNVVLIMADDLGFGDLSLAGHPSIRTPNIDRLAAEGVRFSQFYTSGSICSPTRAGLLTGRYQQRAGIHGLISAVDEDGGIGADEALLSEVLRDSGYATGLFGKWHLGKAVRFSPVRNGFDEFVGFLTGFVDYYTHHDPVERPDLWRGERPIQDSRYLTTLIEEEAIAFIESHQHAPFFLFLSHATPHSPYQPPGEEPREEYPDGSLLFRGPGSPEVYRAMVEDLDRSVGRILQTLDELALLDHTLLIFLSDNGPVGFGTAGALRGAKGTLFEGGIRTPMMVRWPERAMPARVIEIPAISIDLFPTIVEAAQADLPDDRIMDGRSLWPLIDGTEGDHHEALFWRQGPAEIAGELAIRRGGWKLRIATDGQQSLFDLSADPGEREDLSSAVPDVAMELESLLRAWELEVLGR